MTKTFKEGSILELYFNYQDQYQKKLGNDVIVCMQVGAFYEMYYHDSENNQRNKELVYRILELTNLKTSKKAGSNYYMAGFQIDNEEKYFTKILQNNISIVTVVQESSGSNPVRKVSEILSPSTDLTYNVQQNRNYSGCFYITGTPMFASRKPRIYVGISFFDTKTGKSLLYESKTPQGSSNINYPLEECIRLLDTYSPGEILLYIHNPNQYDFIQTDRISKMLGLNTPLRGKCYIQQLNMVRDFQDYRKRNLFLKECFHPKTMVSIDEYLTIENREEVAISYATLMHHIQLHNMRFVEDLDLPSWIDDTKQLLLTTNSAKQLNLISCDDLYNTQKRRNAFTCLLDVLDETKTAMGKRDLKTRLLQPLIDPEEIQKRYEIIEYFIQDKKYSQIRNVLETLCYDIQVYQRKLGIRNLTPGEFSNYALCIQILHSILNHKYVKKCGFYPNDLDIQAFTIIYEDLQTNFCIEKIPSNYQEIITQNFVKEGVFEELDKLELKIENNNRILEAFGVKMSKLIDIHDKNCLKIENNCFVTTSKRAKSILEKLKNYGTHGKIKIEYMKRIYNNEKEQFVNEILNIDVTSITKQNTRSKSNFQIACPVIDTLFYKNLGYHNDLSKKNFEYMEQKINYYKTYEKQMLRVIDFVSKVDVCCNIAHISEKYGYYCPTIKKEGMESYVHIEGIRHPIIERICENEYVKNSIHLNTTQQGILLFGVNATGKSSLMKALGLCIIMAQSGFYVPCDSMTFFPYTQIFTRILNHDNLFTGKSSFEVEMNELRTITYRVKPNSLILGDELCSGTEKDSAIGIFTASVDYIQKMGGQFIFATHYHDLNHQKEISENTNIQSYHLSVEYDDAAQTLLYDRILKKGSGSKNYGIEVCKALHLPEEIIAMATEIRTRNNYLLEPFRASHYNQNVILGGKCEICKTEKSVDAHHIMYQNNANECHIIDGFLQKDSMYNLVALCKKCHNKIHFSKTIIIHGWKQTSNGRILEYSNVAQDKIENTNLNNVTKNVVIQSTQRKKKHSDVIIKRIQELASYNHNPKKIIGFLKNEQPGIRIGEVTIKKIINNDY